MQNTFTKDRESENKEKIGDYAESAFREGQDKAKDITNEAQKRLKQGQEQLGKLVSTVDKQLHDNPWPIVAGVAATCLVLGFIAGTTSKSK